MNLLDRYVIRAVLGGVFVVLAVLLTLFSLFLFAGQQDDIGEGTYSALDALSFVLLNMPQYVYELMPIAVLIGALLGLGQLARGSELTVMRAAGISVWRVAGSVAMAGLLLTVLAVVCGEFLAPPLQAMARKEKALAKFTNISFANRGGARNSPHITETKVSSMPAIATEPAIRHTEMPAARITVSSLPRASAPSPSSEPISTPIGIIS